MSGFWTAETKDFNHETSPTYKIRVLDRGALPPLDRPASRAASVYQYDPNLGTLPQAQGWTLFQDVSTLPVPTVGAGILHQFPNPSPPQTQYWYQQSVPLDFTRSSYSYQLDLHIISSNYLNLGSAQRSGYYMSVYDQVGRTFAVGIASNGITINTDANFNPSNGVQFTPFNTTSGLFTG